VRGGRRNAVRVQRRDAAVVAPHGADSVGQGAPQRHHRRRRGRRAAPAGQTDARQAARGPQRRRHVPPGQVTGMTRWKDRSFDFELGVERRRCETEKNDSRLIAGPSFGQDYINILRVSFKSS